MNKGKKYFEKNGIACSRRLEKKHSPVYQMKTDRRKNASAIRTPNDQNQNNFIHHRLINPARIPNAIPEKGPRLHLFVALLNNPKYPKPDVMTPENT